MIEYAAVELFDLSFLPFLLIEIYSMAAEVYLRSKYSDWYSLVRNQDDLIRHELQFQACLNHLIGGVYFFN